MKYISFLIAICIKFPLFAGLSFSGPNVHVVEIIPEANTGLEAIYVISNCQEVTASYQFSQGERIEWQQFSTLGGAYAQPVDMTIQDNSASVNLVGGDCGYIVNANGRQHCYWIIDYSGHEMTLDDASVDIDESDCAMTAISINGSAPRIVYYTINGAQRELSREIEISYSSLEWDDETDNYKQISVNHTLGYLSSVNRVEAPLCDTEFNISGDRFLREWNRELVCTTPLYTTMAIDAHAFATQEQTDNDNEIKDNSSDLGGSAPVDITFSAVTTDAVAYREWQMSHDQQFDIIDLRFNQDEVEYTFRDQGTTYVRLVVANASGECDWTSDVFQVNIGDSRLECPNAFSPGASEGINDEWKVSYRSIVKYECHIFNRWGIELFQSTDPSVGWDGKYNGKLVPAGVYFYVIKAKGADGKNYNRSGDINIINYNKSTSLPPQE